MVEMVEMVENGEWEWAVRFMVAGEGLRRKNGCRFMEEEPWSSGWKR